ncbi:hypothetical protein QE152_g18104 [Popillia japonica]|uniref:THAP-type domain-containing protein n=1 Tax=Popillia japonica TaxID=7064 RepID=A0AAW1L0U5_POPJA
MVRKWLLAIDRMDIAHKSIEQIRNTYRMCSDHFAANQKFIPYHNRTGLKYNELLTINLPYQMHQKKYLFFHLKKWTFVLMPHHARKLQLSIVI